MNKPNTSRVPLWLRETPIAHRGLHALPDTPENSLAAFANAAEAGYAIEIDVRLLRSGEVVVFHDADWFRMTGQKGIVEETTAAEIANLRLLQTEEQVPLLTDVLQAVAGRIPLLIELKIRLNSVGGALERAVLRTLTGYEGAVALQSFHRATVAYLMQYAPDDVACGQLVASDAAWQPPISASETAPDFLGYAVSVLPTSISAAFRENGGPVLAWTVQNAPQQELVARYADNIIFENFTPNKGNA